MNGPCELVIVGARFPQLALGTLLAKRGRKVLILDQSQAPPSSSQASLRRRPAPLFGLDSDGLLRRFLDELGIGQVLVKRAYPPNKLSYQVVLPRHRINVYPDREATLAEISREFPSSADSFRAFYRDLDAVENNWSKGHSDLSSLERRWPTRRGVRNQFRAWWQSRQVPSRLQKFQDPEREGGFVSLQHLFLGAMRAGSPPSPLSLALIHSLGRRGSFQETLGTASLTGLMATRFGEYGGELRKEVVASVNADRSRGLVELATGEGNHLSARCVATTADLAATIPGFPPAHRNRADKQEPPVPVRFFLGLNPRFVPSGMGDDLFLQREDEGGPLGLKMLYLAMSPAGGSAASREERVLTVTALVPPTVPPAITEEVKNAAESDLLQSLECVIPFLKEGLLSVRSDLVPGEGSRLPHPLGGGLLEWSPALVARASVRRRRGCFIVIGPTPWELGLEGEALSAISAAGTAVRFLGKE